MRWVPYHRTTASSTSSTWTYSPISPWPARIFAQRQRTSPTVETLRSREPAGYSTRGSCRGHPCTGAPAGDGGHIAQGFVRSERVVNVASPAFQAGLEAGEVVAGQAWEDLGFEGAVESFHFSLRLRMVGTPVNDPDGQSHQLGLEPT